MKKFNVIISILLFSFVSHASVMLKMKGKVVSFDQSTIVIQKAKYKYYIKKNAVKLTKKYRFGDAIEIAVPNTGIEKVTKI